MLERKDDADWVKRCTRMTTEADGKRQKGLLEKS